jgi:hypothetical protein
MDFIGLKMQVSEASGAAVASAIERTCLSMPSSNSTAHEACGALAQASMLEQHR